MVSRRDLLRGIIASPALAAITPTPTVEVIDIHPKSVIVVTIENPLFLTRDGVAEIVKSLQKEFERRVVVVPKGLSIVQQDIW